VSGQATLPRRVLMTTDAVGGVWAFATELARGLASLGTETLLVGMGPEPSPAQRATATAIPGLRLEWSTLPLEWMPEAAGSAAATASWLQRLAAAAAVDLVHVNGYAAAALPWPVPCLVTAHSCVLSWWRAVKGAEAPAEWAFYRHATIRGLAGASLVASPTRAFLADLVALYGPLPAFAVVPNGRRADLFAPAAKRPRILTAGRVWDEAKNILSVMQVAGGCDWPVLLAGELRHPSGSEVKAPPTVTILGLLDQPTLARVMGESAIFVLPARYEPFGLAILEAAFSGCALVLGDIPSLRELWQGAALFVPPDDRAALAAGLQRLTRDPDRVAALGRAARLRAAAYDADALTTGYAGLYRRLLDPAAAAA
jgi:glycosyltransferase involved in cell wall biosynthesis